MALATTPAYTVSSAVDSALLEAPSTVILTCVEAEIAQQQKVVDMDEIDLITVTIPEDLPCEPRRHCAINGTLYIKLIIKKEKGKQRLA
jgi:hypothetical protein